MNQRHISLFFLLLTHCLVSAQSDSSLLLKPERLTVDDIIARDFALKEVKIQSATRSVEKPRDVPFSTWVITSEEILRYGFITLADVLKAAPGMRVSQPGNALEGETFMMRGMSGNQNLRIMINDVPIKPIMTPGMPIGSQLPIRQAERIEVVYSPMGVLYGNEACIGVVNIILKESERPIFTQADLNFGSLGHNNLDLMFGGKLFRDKNVLHFSTYGSSTVRSRNGTEDYTNNYNLNNYLPLGLNDRVYQINPNFEVDELDSNRLQTKVLPIAHESRMFGLNIKWHGFKFSFHNLSRKDVSYLGYSPLSASYGRSGNEFKEQIQSYTLQYQRALGTFESNTYLSVLTYDVASTTAGSLIFDQTNFASFLASGGKASSSQSTLNTLYRRIADAGSSGSRFGYARSLDVRLESRGTARLWRNLYAEAGIQVTNSRGVPYYLRYSKPVSDVNDINILPFAPNSLRRQNAIATHQFGQLDWRGRKTRVLSGFGFNIDESGISLSSRYAAMYHIDSSLSVFANYASAFKKSQIYQEAHVFSVGGVSSGLSEPTYSIRPQDYLIEFVPEVTQNFEAGFRRTRKSSLTELSVFHLNAYNLARDGKLDVEKGQADIGYYQHNGLSLNTWGVVFKNSAESKDRSLGENNPQTLSIRGDIFIQYARGAEWFGRGLPATDEVRNQPRWTSQVRFSAKVGNFQVMFATNRQTSVLSKAVTYKDQWQRTNIQERYPKFRSTDLIIRYYLNKNFVLYSQGLNVFNRNIYGLDSTGTQDDLLAPLQPGRQIRLGVNYNMN